jgi:hypothetical protein
MGTAKVDARTFFGLPSARQIKFLLRCFFLCQLVWQLKGGSYTFVGRPVTKESREQSNASRVKEAAVRVKAAYKKAEAGRCSCCCGEAKALGKVLTNKNKTFPTKP